MNGIPFAETRRALHAVAELVLAGPQYRTSGTIRLRVCPGALTTIAEPNLRLEATDLVRGSQRLPLSGATCGALAKALGVEPRGPDGLYSDGSGADPDELLQVDPAAARTIVEWFAAGDAAMRALHPASEPVLWPEHFDLGITADDISYGVSAGDVHYAEPYAYVTPPAARIDEFWNAAFGAARGMRELTDADGVLSFFREGRHQARADG